MEVSCNKLFEYKSNSLENIVQQQKERLLAKVNILLGENVRYNQEVVDRVEEFLGEYQKPLNINPSKPDNLVEQRDASFEKLCLLLSSKGVQEPEKLTAYQFYKRIEIETTKKPRQNG